jgi:SAM-dependent methyltransferase
MVEDVARAYSKVNVPVADFGLSSALTVALTSTAPAARVAARSAPRTDAAPRRRNVRGFTAMNYAHALICSSGWWARIVERELLPWGLAGVDLGADALEIGPGFGATTRVLARDARALTVLELDHGYCERLRRGLPASVEVVEGDATQMPFDDARFSGVVCFTMLHHVPSAELQDRLLAEVSRVLAPGGVFAGTDSIGDSRSFRLLHLRDTLVPVAPGGLAARIERAGLIDPKVDAAKRSFRFRARKPAP